MDKHILRDGSNGGGSGERRKSRIKTWLSTPVGHSFRAFTIALIILILIIGPNNLLTGPHILAGWLLVMVFSLFTGAAIFLRIKESAS